MKRLIDKDAVVAEIENIRKHYIERDDFDNGWNFALDKVLSFINALETIDPYEQYIQYASIEVGIEAHAEDYSFNIESELFQQLTKEQQVLWRKEIEQAVISGGYNGLDLARDPRYKENHEVKEVDLEVELANYNREYVDENGFFNTEHFAKHFFELGLQAQKGE